MAVALQTPSDKNFRVLFEFVVSWYAVPVKSYIPVLRLPRGFRLRQGLCKVKMK